MNLIVATAAIASTVLTLPVLQAGSLDPSFISPRRLSSDPTTKVRIFVSNAGAPTDCVLAAPFGSQADAEAVCAMVMRTARFTPARDMSGAPAAGSIILWSRKMGDRWIGSRGPDWDPIDVAFHVTKLPRGLKEMSTFTLNVQIDSAGKVMACKVDVSRLTVGFAKLLCDQAAIDPVPAPQTRAGVPAAGIEQFRVRVQSQAHSDKVMARIKRIAGDTKQIE